MYAIWLNADGSPLITMESLPMLDSRRTYMTRVGGYNLFGIFPSYELAKKVRDLLVPEDL